MVPMTETASAPGPEVWKRLDATVRRVDEDRWLSSRYAAPQDRRKLVALYAFYYELAKVRLVTEEPGLAAIRFQWWRETVDEIRSGAPARRHEVELALAETVHDPRENLNGLIDGHAAAVQSGDRRDEPEPLLMRLAAARLGETAWAGFETVAVHFAGGRRGVTGCAGEAVAKVPPVIRPAVAHGRLRHVYARNPDPSPLARRWAVLRGVMTGRV